MRPTQFFSQAYLEQCRRMKPGQIVQFLEDFRLLHARPRKRGSRLISMKVPEELLAAFRAKAELNGVLYQTQIKRLMAEWLGI